MIVTVHLLCGRGCRMGGGGRFLYDDNTTALKAGFGACSPRKILKKIVSFGAFLFISGSDFVLNNFKNDHFNIKKVMILTVHKLLWGGILKNGCAFILK